ncbi:ATP-binding cassette domain-containing protein [Patescibacteria group bacterium]|nr:ATP-binding cassette domain-containing protein [Patescibacteria group bacterium]MBU1673849.1 ATP-binding cassette domain-containing protein [Patescibacteria group bacterium]MBU1963226.1 ATP-binding cassette domain-containing protein [Patescibacteria group bacterium]
MKSVDVQNLTRKFKLKGGKKITAVDNVSFSIEDGEIFGFLGPNGAGKSTTINILATIDKATSGDATVNHFSVSKNKDEVRKSIGIVFQDSSLDDRLTALENLKFHALLYGVNKNDFEKRVNEVMKLVDLWERRNTIVKNFSGGMKRRLEIARGLIHYPSVLILDEPTTGLDPQTRNLLWEYLFKIKKERDMTIMMTTHYMEEAENCDRIGIIDRGKLVALETPAKLKHDMGGDLIRLKSDDVSALKKELKEKFNLETEKYKEFQQIKVVRGEEFLPELLKKLDTKIKAVELREPNLDDVFLSLTGHEIRDEKASDHEKMASHIGPGRGRH